MASHPPRRDLVVYLIALTGLAAGASGLYVAPGAKLRAIPALMILLGLGPFAEHLLANPSGPRLALDLALSGALLVMIALRHFKDSVWRAGLADAGIFLWLLSAFNAVRNHGE